MSALSRWAETLRRLRPSQVGHRLVARVRGRAQASPRRAAAYGGIPALPPESRRPRAFPFDRPAEGGWSFAGHGAALSGPGGIAWAEGDAVPLLARYHAGYAEWVRAMAEDGEGERAATLLLAAVPSLPSHPYVSARRVLSLVEARALGAAGVEALLRQDAAGLARRVEWDVRGNHLVADGAALHRAGHAFRGGGARHWRALGASILSACSREQVLSDGVHYERSPVYQGIVLEHFLVALETAARAGEAPPRGVEEASRRLAASLLEMTLPDGALLRWRDGAPGMALPTASLVAWARARAGPLPAARQGPRAFRAAGLAIVETPDGRSAATLLASAPCPRDLPAHGQADALAYEAVLDGVRVVASAGTADYAAGASRDRDRLPGAFAGCLVNGRPPAEPWASFRVGARGWVRRLETGAERQASFAAATSDGFLHTVAPVLHRRTMTLAPGPHLAVVDEWTGRGELEVTLFFPVAPGLSATLVAGGAVVAGEAGTFRLEAPGYSLSVEDGSFATALGTAVSRPVLRAVARVALPARRAHAWTTGRLRAHVQATPIPAGEVRVDVEGGTGRTSVFVPAGLSP